MSIRRFLLKLAYPAYRFLSSFTSRGAVIAGGKTTPPAESIYDSNITLNDGTQLEFNSLKGKKILLVNTASDCVYTAQYAGLQQLHEEMRDRLVIIGFPSNDFSEQEKGSDKEIAAFCSTSYHISFPLATKSHVIGARQNSVYRWLTNKNKNGWNAQAPQWNFSKYLVDEHGVLTHYLGPAVSPSAIKKLVAGLG